MDTLATVAMYNGRPAEARNAAIRGLSQAPRGKAVEVRLGCQLTRAYGRLGEAAKFDEALATTRRQLDSLPERGSGLFSADAGRIASYAATSSIWLDRPEQAVTYAGEALDFYGAVAPGESSPTREAISRLDLGLALIATKQPDAATEHSLRALDSERITSTVLARARDVNGALQRHYPGASACRAVRDRYQVLAASQARQLQLTTP